MLACCVPVVSRHTRTEEARQVQEQDLGQKEHSQPGCVCALIALANTVADGWAVMIKPVNAPAQHQPLKYMLQRKLPQAKCWVLVNIESSLCIEHCCHCQTSERGDALC